MNRGKKPMTAKNKKSQKKESTRVSEAVPAEAVTEKGTWKILSKFPPKPAVKAKEQVDSMKKGVASKKKKQCSKHSKRSTPGQVEEDITPYAHRHPENKKVTQNLQKQNVQQSRRVTKKLSKKK